MRAFAAGFALWVGFAGSLATSRAEGDGDGTPTAKRPAASVGVDIAPGPTGKELIERLSDEERARLRRAVQEVWNRTEVSEKREALQRATREFRAALKNAIDAQGDPELKRVMMRLLAEHYVAEKKAARPALRPDAVTLPHGEVTREHPAVHSDRAGRGVLSDEEQKMLAAAREAALKNPAVVASIRDRESAVDHSSKMLAAREFRVAMREAMLKADPRIAAVFAKLDHSQRDAPPEKPKARAGRD